MEYRWFPQLHRSFDNFVVAVLVMEESHHRSLEKVMLDCMEKVMVKVTTRLNYFDCLLNVKSQLTGDG
jgi:hypothetical protein